MKKLLVLVVCLALIISCKKKEAEASTPSPVPNSTSAYTIKDYLPLKYGNYWVYEITKTDTNGIVTFITLDSCYVRDSLFTRSKWFYWISGGNHNCGTFTDSASNIINDSGVRTLSFINNDSLSQTSNGGPGWWYNMHEIMKTSPTTFVFNSNTYSNCINRYSYFYSNMNPNCNNWIIYSSYCPGVGLVYSKYGFINQCDVWELKLLRYKIN